MSRRLRAAGFGLAALLCAGLAAGLAAGYRSEVGERLGRLRPVLVARERLPPGRPLRPAELERKLEVRRVPVRFAPPATLASPAGAAGLAPLAPIPAGSYLLAEQLRPPGRRGRKDRPTGNGLAPVELAVVGAGALASDRRLLGSPVDVVVTGAPRPGGATRRTYVAAEGVRLLDLAPSRGMGGIGSAPDVWTATLALEREQALRLIAVEASARSLRLIPSIPG